VTERFEELNERRRGAYAKDASDEAFLADLNRDLEPRELALYEDYPIEHPFVFVVGLPRSGTTLLSQVLAYCLDAGYVNNVAARFWLAPVHGIRLARVIAGSEPPPAFESDYARTPSLLGIHEFGYFWRRWLEKHTFEDVARAAEAEDELDWAGLRRTLANVQHELGKPFVAKNMLGAYHIPRLRWELGPVVWVWIERDPLDAAVSILDARRRYFEDPSTWWSYVPIEYPELKDLDHWRQIAGQVHYLTRLYERAFAELGPDAGVRVTYEQLARDPGSVLEAVAERARAAYGAELRVRQAPPASFAFRRHDDRAEDKARFERLLADLAGADAA
jgi:LPS sulfotransferase NodH